MCTHVTTWVPASRRARTSNPLNPFMKVRLPSKEEKLNLSTKKVALPRDAYTLLRIQKKKQGISMAKIVTNLIYRTYGS